ncbi:hypothetical protein HA402_008127 [Bradysia odoriphaga]|nr:hypothetical protein HA402_008127 [Bradysia odoriphaga]
MCFATNKERLFSRMSRVKSRTQIEICGDCGGDPSWASINRGILLCSECCSVHRSLGRHISQVKSLRQGSWPPSVFTFVNALNSHGANSVWEHCLMDSVAPKGLKRKPTPKDPLHPTKADFIRAKHVNLSFVLKPNSLQLEDGGGGNLENELSKQLRASVRSANLEMSLRFLVQGADPNYYHEETGSTPLHVAAKSGQASQIELLIVYGADVAAKDSQGNTAIEIARNNKNFAIADRLTEALYEVTDRLTMFLGGKKPDHASGQHFTFPEQTNIEISEQLKIARGKLQLVPNRMFEELVMDLYDEVDRREMEAIWATSALNPDIGAVPFLPTNPHLSATRNQGRQKLARFSPSEFAGLVTDVLVDARRRQNMAALRPIDSPLIPNIALLRQQTNRQSNLSDDEPLYDAVASDDDYAALVPAPQQTFVHKGPINTISNTEVENLRRKLLESFSEIDELKSMVEKLSFENDQLKSRIDPNDTTADFDVPLRIDIQTNGADETETENEPVSDGRSSKRPVSMFEPREGPYTKAQQIPESRTTNSMYQMAVQKRVDPTLPLSEEVKHRTDLVTRRIQELWSAMQDVTLKDAFVPCSERIRVAVAELAAIFPTAIVDETIKTALKQLNQNTGNIQTSCTRLQRALLNDDITTSDLFMQEVRNYAYNLAMATKMLVTQFP